MRKRRRGKKRPTRTKETVLEHIIDATMAGYDMFWAVYDGKGHLTVFPQKGGPMIIPDFTVVTWQESDNAVFISPTKVNGAEAIEMLDRIWPKRLWVK